MLGASRAGTVAALRKRFESLETPRNSDRNSSSSASTVAALRERFESFESPRNSDCNSSSPAGTVAALRQRFDSFEASRNSGRTSSSSSSSSSNASKTVFRCSQVSSLKDRFEGRCSNATTTISPSSESAATVSGRSLRAPLVSDQRKVRTFNFGDLVAIESAMRNCRDLTSLRNLIQQAGELGLPHYRIREYESLLVEAEADQTKLQTAITSRKIEILENALRNMTSFLHEEPEHSNALLLLEHLRTERTENTQSLLIECRNEASLALKSDVSGDLCRSGLEKLNMAISRGKDHDVSRAVLASAENVAAKFASRLRLDAALRVADVEELSLSIQEAQQILDMDLVIDHAVRCLCTLVAERATKTHKLLRECMTRALTESVDGFTSRKTSQDLRDAIKLGESHGVESYLIVAAKEVMCEVVSTCVFQCGVCLEVEHDVHPMPCCGRLEGSNVLCDSCIAVLVAQGARCPFCRASTSFR